jgi:hypothetical protein
MIRDEDVEQWVLIYWQSCTKAARSKNTKLILYRTKHGAKEHKNVYYKDSYRNIGCVKWYLYIYTHTNHHVWDDDLFISVCLPISFWFSGWDGCSSSSSFRVKLLSLVYVTDTLPHKSSFLFLRNQIKSFGSKSASAIEAEVMSTQPYPSNDTITIFLSQQISEYQNFSKREPRLLGTEATVRWRLFKTLSLYGSTALVDLGHFLSFLIST